MKNLQKHYLLVILVLSTLFLGGIWLSVLFVEDTTAKNAEKSRLDSMAANDERARADEYCYFNMHSDSIKNLEDSVKKLEELESKKNSPAPVTVIVEENKSSTNISWREMITWVLGTINTMIGVVLGYKKFFKA